MAKRSFVRKLVGAAGGTLLLLAACTSGQPQGEATTAPSASPVSPPPSATPNQSPSPSPSVSPTPTEPATTTVYYDISTAWIPFGDAKGPKETRVTLVFQEVDGGPEISHSPMLDAPSPFELEPGTYEALRIIFPPKAFNTKDDVTIALLNGKGENLHGPRFTVPEADCAYLGFILLTFVRLERTDDIAGQFDLIAEASQGAAVSATILQQGSILWYVNDVDAITTGVDPEAQRKTGAEGCEVSPWKDPVR
jgi:hypothetical protein